MMPGLPKSSVKQDISDFKRLFDDQRLKPDMLKIYPTVVIKNTGLYKLYKEKKYTSYSTDDLVSILVDIKKTVPPWVRIMRIQREIEPNDVISGPKIGNLRQLVSLELKKQGVKCKCIRCREIGLKDTDREYSQEDLTLFREDYLSSEGKEIFLSFESKDKETLFGFLRLRIMSNPQRKELMDMEKNHNTISSSTHSKAFQSAIVRELHVYGPLVRIGSKPTEYSNNLKGKESLIYQHKGLGQNLLKEAEKICKVEFNIKKLSVISAIGTREYYKKFGYVINGPYVTKAI
jgi:elongator complex protein 3